MLFRSDIGADAVDRGIEIIQPDMNAVERIAAYDLLSEQDKSTFPYLQCKYKGKCFFVRAKFRV